MHITHIHLKRNECVLGVAHCALSMAPILIQNRWEFTEWMNEWINKWGHYWMTERMLQAFSDWRLAEDLVLPGLHSIRSKSAFFFFCIRRNKSLIKREREGEQYGTFSVIPQVVAPLRREERERGSGCLLWEMCLDSRCPRNAHVLFLMKVNYFNLNLWFHFRWSLSLQIGNWIHCQPHGHRGWPRQWYFSPS